MFSIVTAWALTIAAQQWTPPGCNPEPKTPPTLGIPRGEIPINVKPIEPEPKKPKPSNEISQEPRPFLFRMHYRQ